MTGGTLAGCPPARPRLRSARAMQLLADAELARRVAAGDAAAADEFARRFVPRLRAFARRHLDAEAADLVHDVLLRALAALRRGEVRDHASIAGYLLAMARNRARELQRQQRRQPQPVGDAAALDDAAAAAAAAAEASDVLAQDRLADCMQQLAERERSVVLLTFYRDHGAEQIAAALALQAGNVRVIRHRALQRLRRCMGVAES